MNEQLQTEGKSNLEDCMAASKLGQSQNLDLGEQPSVDRASVDPKTLPSEPLAQTIATIVQPQQVEKNSHLMFASLELSALKIGKSLLDIQHRSDAGQRRKPYYATSITNRSTEQIRIDKFSTYVRTGKVLVLHSITGGCFSAQQFQEWYDLDRREWLEPGQTVTDPNNHSNLGVYWVYFGTTASGREFVTGAAWTGGKSWWRLW
jgi:hypothetical protein